MNWTDQIFRYCERGLDPAFWAEPANAISNAAFFLAALAAGAHLAGRGEGPRTRPASTALIALVVAIGIGSFMFHTYATRWASVADTAPIGIFMLAYLAYALKRLAGVGWLATGLGVIAFVAAMRLAGDIPCAPGLLPITRAGGHPCFNGSLGYLPALAAMLLIGAALRAQGKPAGTPILAAGLIFALSLIFRSIDFEVCSATRLAGQVRGTHALWHMLNAATLYLLLRAAIRHGRSSDGRA